MNKMEAEVIRKILCEFLGFLKHKIETGSLTLDEEQAMVRLFENTLPLSATAEDLADYYGQTPVAIRSVIHRKLLKKPRRRVMYDFKEFRKVAPDKWKK